MEVDSLTYCNAGSKVESPCRRPGPHSLHPPALGSPGSPAPSTQALNPGHLRYHSEMTVAVYWINYNGREQKYNTLTPGRSYVQSTFVTHPWVLREVPTGKFISMFVAQPSYMTVTTK
eukprot:GO256354.1.p1 GENE.GO256354.1~~GO256354.1.p1  ORF type:complete len:137 (+),score=6.64 GO256354.1:60-413(+)